MGPSPESPIRPDPGRSPVSAPPGRRAASGGAAMKRQATAVALLGVTAARLLAAQCPDGAPPPCRTATRPVSVPAPNSVAVLYFDNLSADTTDAYLADGLTEEVAARLGDIRRLMVKQASEAALAFLEHVQPRRARFWSGLRAPEFD